MTPVPGKFLGRYESERRLDGVALAELVPTVPEHEVATHTHDDAHLVLLLKGAYLSTARGMPAVCTTRALVLNPPGTTHRDCFRGLNGRFFTLSLPQERWVAALDRRQLPAEAIKLSGKALFRASLLRHELRVWDSASTLAVETGIEELLDAAQTEQQLLQGIGPAWLERARERLQDQCDDAPRLADLAALADVHPVYFSRAFRRRYGCSPGAYLRQCRMDLALSLLPSRNLRLAEVARRCGFLDQSHFSHAFRRAHGCTPQQFRQLS